MKLWLDDIRPAPEGWFWVKNAWEALRLVVFMGEDFFEWSLDHDLGENNPTGYDFLCIIENLLAKECKLFIPKEIYVHSANFVGKIRMLEVVKSIQKLVEK